MITVSRRGLLAGVGAIGAGFLGLRHWLRGTGIDEIQLGTQFRPYGELIPDPEGLLDLPAGFQYRVISRTGDQMDDGLLVPGLHDGMAAFAGSDGKTVLVRNHENIADEAPLGYAAGSGPFGEHHELLRPALQDRLYDAGGGRHPSYGGTTTLVYDTREQRLEKHFLSLGGTQRNCAGGATPWGSWVTCEETVQTRDEPFEQDHGFNFEVPANAEGGLVTPRPLKAMGRFNHEAVAVHPASGIVYQTEDRQDGLFYRFLPNRPGDLASGGRLQALVVRGQAGCLMCNWEEKNVAVGVPLPVSWIDIANVESPDDDLRYQGESNGAAVFSRSEGIWCAKDSLFFASTDGGKNRSGQIFCYRPSPSEGTPQEDRIPGTIELFLEPNDTNVLNYADNLTIAPWGDVIIAEDSSGVDRLVGITMDGRIYHLAANRLNDSELAGPAFSPDGTTLFVNIQTPGLTIAIAGPWQSRQTNV